MSGAAALRRLAGRWAGVIALACLVAACSGAAPTPPLGHITPAPKESPGASASVAVQKSPVAGIVTSIDSTGLTEVHGFTLNAANGEALTFVMGNLENAIDFAPGHLAEHQASADPVLVYFRVENGQLVVYRLEDAP